MQTVELVYLGVAVGAKMGIREVTKWVFDDRCPGKSMEMEKFCLPSFPGVC